MNTTEKLFKILGYSGGTIHDLSEDIGLEVSQILEIENLKYKDNKNKQRDVGIGLLACTCTGEYIRQNLLPKYYGSFNFWKAAIRGLDLGFDKERLEKGATK